MMLVWGSLFFWGVFAKFSKRGMVVQRFGIEICIIVEFCVDYAIVVMVGFLGDKAYKGKIGK
mgnify:CR=1 FL=1